MHREKETTMTACFILEVGSTTSDDDDRGSGKTVELVSVTHKSQEHSR